MEKGGKGGEKERHHGGRWCAGSSAVKGRCVAAARGEGGGAGKVQEGREVR